MKVYFFCLFFFLNNNLYAQYDSYFEAQPYLEDWVKERVNNAKKGKKEIVEFPMAVRSRAWGSRCPYHYMGISPNNHEGPWLMPITPKDFPVSDEKGHQLMVVGYFTGKKITKDYRKKEGEPKEWVYSMPEFKVMSWKINTRSDLVGGPKILK